MYTFAVRFIHLAGQFTDSFLFVYLVSHLFQPKKKKYISRPYHFLAVLIGAAAFFLSDTIPGGTFYRYIILILTMPFLYSMLFYQGHFLLKMTMSLICTLLIFSCESFFVSLLGHMIRAGSDSMAILFIYFMRRIGSKLLLFILIKRILEWSFTYQVELPASCLTWLLAVTAADILIFFLGIPERQEKIPDKVILTLFLSAIPLFFLITIKYLSIDAKKREILSAQVSQEKIRNQYLQQQVGMSESLRKFRHDYKSQLFCMDALLEGGKYSELHDYLTSLHQYDVSGGNVRRYVEDESLNILLNQKADMAEKCSIRFETDIVLPEKGKIRIADLNSLVGNLCDNAIEAAVLSADPWIRLTIHRKKAYIALCISNSCAYNVKKKNPDFHTSKGNREAHGYGIQIIRSIVEKYDGTYQVESTDSSFTTKIMLLDE